MSHPSPGETVTEEEKRSYHPPLNREGGCHRLTLVSWLFLSLDALELSSYLSISWSFTSNNGFAWLADQDQGLDRMSSSQMLFQDLIYPAHPKEKSLEPR